MARKIIFFLLKLYWLTISPFFQVVFNIHCRYEESCSCYMERAIKEQGVLRGSLKGLKRFLSCNQFTSLRSIQNG